MNTPAPFSISLPQEFYDDLDRRIKQAVAEAIGGNIQEPKSSTYLTRKQVCKLLNISLPTLIAYCDRGFIHAQKIGNRVLINEQLLNTSLLELPVTPKNRKKC